MDSSREGTSYSWKCLAQGSFWTLRNSRILTFLVDGVWKKNQNTIFLKIILPCKIMVFRTFITLKESENRLDYYPLFENNWLILIQKQFNFKTHILGNKKKVVSICTFLKFLLSKFGILLNRMTTLQTYISDHDFVFFPTRNHRLFQNESWVMHWWWFHI